MGKGKKGLGRDGEIEERERLKRDGEIEEGEIEERWDEEIKKRRAQQRSRRRSFRMR